MQTDILRGELERLFELDELAAVSRDLLGFDPGEVGGTAAKGSFADALTTHCIEKNAVEALCDVLLATREGVDPRINEMRVTGMQLEHSLRSGDQVGALRIARRLGEGRVGVVYLARLGHQDYRIKVLRPAAIREQRGLNRYLTLNRLIGKLKHGGLPRNIEVGRQAELYYVAHEMVEGQSLAARMAWAGPMHMSEVRPLLIAILEPLTALHGRRLAHGDLHLDNIIVTRAGSGEPRVVLVDAGCDRLRVPGRFKNGSTELFSTTGSPATVAPEQILGQAADPRSDVYSFGAVMFQLLGGRPVFTGSALESAFSHLSQPPPALGRIAPHGWVSPDAEELVHSLLAKDPNDRPKDARQVLELLQTLGRRDSGRHKAAIDEKTLTESIERLLEDPLDETSCRNLENLVERGASTARIAEALSMASDMLDDGESTRQTKAALLLRAARLYESQRETLPSAEKAYEAALSLLPDDELALAGLEEVRKLSGRFEELIEMLLQKNEKAKTAEERAQNFSEIGNIYASELSDPEQALVAFTQAVTEDPQHQGHATGLERAAGSSERAWQDVLGSLGEAVQEASLKSEVKVAIYLRLAEWYPAHLQRFDLAIPCLDHVLAVDPHNERALEMLADIYRRSQQWRELGATLSRHAECAPAPLARDLRTEAAEILEHQLGDAGGARDLYEKVLDKDPGHTRAAEGLGRICERMGDHQGLAKVLRRQSAAQRGAARERALCRLAEVASQHLDAAEEATKAYEQVLAENPNHLEALRGIDKVLSQAGRHRELLEVLEREIELAATPRQKILLERRVAAIFDAEFLDHENAAAAHERILQLDRADQEALLALSKHYRALERWEPLSQLYEKLLQLETEPARRVDYALAWGRLLTDQITAPERAAHAYELVLEVEPKHEAALDALARLKETSGDATAALEAILLLADKAKSPYEKSQQFLRAANLLSARGNLERAIEHYKHAVDADPDNAELRSALRKAYVECGDYAGALRLLEREFERTDGERAKAKLSSEMARLARDGLKDDERAEVFAKRALEFDPNDLESLILVADLAFENQHFLEASRYFESVDRRVDALPKAEAKRVLLRYVEALARSEKLAKGEATLETLRELVRTDPEALERLAHLMLEYGQWARAIELYRQLLDQFEGKLALELEGPIHLRYGEALSRADKPHAALRHLERSSELCPELMEPLEAQASIHAQLRNWQEVELLKQRQLRLASGDTRIQLLLDLGDIAREHLNDQDKAAKAYLEALEERPDERRVLTKLMQLYSEQEAWNKLVEVVLKLAKFVEAPAQKAKYLETAAVVTAQQIGNIEGALEYYERAFELQPSPKALNEAIDIYSEREDHLTIERLFRLRLEVAKKEDDKPQMLATFVALAELYERKLGDLDNAIDAYEAAHTLDPDNQPRAQLLGELYLTAPKKYLEKGVALQARLLSQDPQRAPAYQMLRRLYSEVGATDASWCLCQALSALRLGTADELRFYERLRSTSAARAQVALTDEDWLMSVLHPLTDPLLTSVFALIEPAVIAVRSESLEDFGYTDAHRIDPSSHYSSLSQSLYHASGALGVPLPPTFENTNDPGGLAFLHTFEPSVVLGNAALNAEVPGQAAAFIAARHLSYLRPGLYLRQLVGSGTGLKSWLFAAIKLISPGFPVAAEMEGPINEALEALKRAVQGQTLDHLTRVVTKMLQTGAALDIKRWIMGVDLTADRAGFILANSLETALEILEVSDDSSSAVGRSDREKELILYSVSPEYFRIRKTLGISAEE